MSKKRKRVSLKDMFLLDCVGEKKYDAIKKAEKKRKAKLKAKGGDK